MTGLDRLAVFVDYQNAYMGTRQALGAGTADPHTMGQFDPLKLARLITQRHPSYQGANLRQLVQVSIYRGLPGAGNDSTGYGATRKQVAQWRSNGSRGNVRFDIHLRPLDYSLGRPREKGIDVLLALDLAFGASNGQFDVVVLFSGDSDLMPALERASVSGVMCESASWRDGGRRLPKKPCVAWEHRLTQLDYSQVEDSTDYR